MNCFSVAGVIGSFLIGLVIALNFASTLPVPEITNKIDYFHEYIRCDGILSSKLSHSFSKKFHKVVHVTGTELNLKKVSSLFTNGLAIKLIK